VGEGEELLVGIVGAGREEVVCVGGGGGHDCDGEEEENAFLDSSLLLSFSAPCLSFCSVCVAVQ
jgi:hypothetical protein